ncbi:MAG: hypothetical protein RIB43_15095 [Rhodospirillaceae bacterium]
MSKYLITYYSRTGHTKALALAIRDALGADTIEIQCQNYKHGPLGYLRAGYDSVKGNLPLIYFPDTDFSAYDCVIMGAPIWTSYPALPLRAFLHPVPDLPRQIGVFLTYGGHSPPEKAFQYIENLLPNRLQARLTLNSKDIGSDLQTEAIQTFVEHLSAQ